MDGSGGSGGQGDGYGRALLGVMGVVFALAGMLITWFIVTTWPPYAFLAATPGLVLAAYGMQLLFACAFYNVVDVVPGRFGVPTVKARARRGPR